MKFRPWKAAHNVWKVVPHFLIFVIFTTLISAAVVGAGGHWWQAPAAVLFIALICGLVFGGVVLWNIVDDILSRKRSQEYAKELLD